VDVRARLARHYPFGASMVHAIGYVGRINEQEQSSLDSHNYSGTTHTGKVGVEKRYEDRLHGRVGFQQIEVNAEGRVIRVLQDQAPVPGEDLILSLDSRLQLVAEEALGEHSGAVVALDPRTGEILALVSKPGFDANLFVNGISTTDYRALRRDGQRPLFNRAVSGQYPPGSTIKPILALAGLEHGITTAERTIFAGPHYMLPGDTRKYRDWKKGGHGWVDMDKAITQSCDVYFYDLAYRLGVDRMHDFLSRFGLGGPTRLDSTGEAPGLVPSSIWKQRTKGQVWFPGETLSAGIGQGYMLTTPLQLAAATAALAMRGERVQPRLVRQLRAPSGAAELMTTTQAAGGAVRLTDPTHWEAVIQPMVHVMHRPNGTGFRTGRDAPYSIAGKTGTAQVFTLGQDEEYDAEQLARHLRDHALFVAFAPVREPRIAVAVIVEHAGGGGKFAAPVARRVMDAHLEGGA
jgi:penicillin-binding protein 2